MRTIETAFQPPGDKEDDIDYFFKSTALTVKSFSPAEKAEEKINVTSVVSGIEMRRFAIPNYEFADTNSDQSLISERLGSNQ